jgi:protein TonB
MFHPHHRTMDQVKFVKPVVAKAEEVTEEPPKIVEIKEKSLVLKRLKRSDAVCP